MDLHIPSDTLFNIFTLLKRSELAKVSLVCKEWKKVTLNPHFVWPIALKFRAGCDWHREFEKDDDGFGVFSSIEESPPRDYFIVKAKYRKIEVKEQDFNFYAFDWNVEIKDNEPLSPEKICKLYKLAQDHPMIFKFQLRFIKNPKKINFRKMMNRRGKWQPYKTHCTLNIEIFFRVNFASFEKHFSKRPVDKNFPGAEFIFESVANEHAHLISQWCRTHEFKQATIPIKTVVPQKQPYGFTSDITLKKYQLNAISWMKSIEEDVDVGFDCSELVGWRAAGTKVLFDLVNDNFVLSHVEVGDYVKHVSAKGGILADEMGLGKTLTMVGLILANPGDPLNVSMADDKLSFEDDEEEEEENNEAPAKKAKKDKDEDEEMDELKEKSKGKKEKNENENEEENENENENKNEEKKQKDKDDRLPEHLLFKTQATVVICPNHLVQQWQGEIAKRTSPPLCVIILTTKNDLFSTTYNDIVEADVVIVSATLLKNPNYFNLGRSATASISKGAEERRIASWVPTSLVRIRKTAEGGLTQKKPILEHFLWHRIVLDEGHEVLDDPFYQLTLKSIKAKYYWYMSGTPFPNSKEVMYGVVNYLQFPPTEAYKSWSYVDLAVENLYWRNTKESTKDEYDIPDTVEDVVLMDFTDIERIYYESADKEDEQRAMCGWLQMSDTVKNISGDADRKTLTKLRQDAINHKKEKITSLVETLNQYKMTLKALKGRPNITEPVSRQIKSVASSIVVTEGEIKKYTLKLINLEHSKKYEGPDMSSTATIQSKDDNNNNNNKNNNTTTTTTKETTKEKTAEETENSNKKKDDEGEEKKEEEKDKKEEDGEAWDETKLKKLTIPKLTALMSKMGMKAAEPKTRKADLISGILKFQKNSEKSAESVSEKEKGKETKKTDGKRKREEEEEEEESEPAPRPIVRSESLLKSKQQDQLNLLYLVDQLGTKLGNFIHYLKKLWEQSSKHRVIVFSQFNTMLHQISEVLSSQGIESAFVQGNVLRRNRALSAFKSEDSTIRVILLSLENAASGTNLVEASHIILLDPVTGTRKEAQAVESQAIGRAHRQGQTNQVTVVRFLIRNTIEHTMYIQNYLEEVKEDNGEEDNDNQCTPISTPTKSSRPKLMRTSTIGTMLATHTLLRRNRSIMDLIENDNLL